MSEVAEPPVEAWHELLLARDNEAWLVRALESLSPKYLVKVFLDSFPPHHGDITVLTGKRMKQVAAEDVIGRVGKIRARRPDILRKLVDFWTLVQKDLSPEDVSPEVLAVNAWLWSQTDAAPPPTWDLVQQVVEDRLASRRGVMALEAQLRSAQQELAKGKDQDQLEAELEAERAKSRQLKQSADSRAQILKQKDGEIAALRRTAEAHNLQAAQLQRSIDDQAARHDKTLQSRDERNKDLYAQYLSEKSRRDELANLNNGLLKELADVKADRDEVDRYAQELELELEDFEKKARTADLPLSQDALQTSLIIDYEALGETSHERLTLLLDLYEAALVKQPHVGLAKTNWPTLNNGEFQGILLLGLETLLLDAVELPIRRFLQMQSFSKEALLRSLVHKIESPRLRV